jgi:hypothetical protein
VSIQVMVMFIQHSSIKNGHDDGNDDDVDDGELGREVTDDARTMTS